MTHESAEGIFNYTSGLKTLHALAEFKVPDVADIKTRIQLQGVKREKVHQVKQAAPITPKIFIKDQSNNRFITPNRTGMLECHFIRICYVSKIQQFGAKDAAII